jgi:methionyl-tRNA formyltransferase
VYTHIVIEIGPIPGVLLLGGGKLLLELSLELKTNEIPVRVITSPRHANEIIKTDKTLESFLRENEIDFLITSKITSEEAKEFLNQNSDCFFLSISAPWIFSENTIKTLFQNRLFNCHSTRLPNNRGGGGFSWQILMGNRFGVCVLHQVDEGIDTGPIIAFDEFLYPANLRIPMEFEEFLLDKNLEFLKSFINDNRNIRHRYEKVLQSEYLSTYWPRLNTNLNGWINWDWNAHDIEKFICAFDEPYKGAQTMLNNQNVNLKGVSVSAQDGNFHPFQSGLIYRVSKSWICVAIQNSTLIITGLFDKDGNSILGKVRVGDRFVTPKSQLGESLKRVHYNSTGLSG